MKVTTLVLNAAGEPHFRSEEQINIENLFEVAKSRAQGVRDMGAEMSVGAISFYGGEVLKAVDTGEHSDLSKAVISMLLASWLFDSVHGGLSTDKYLESDMEYTITSDGIVVHTRVQAAAAA